MKTNKTVRNLTLMLVVGCAFVGTPASVFSQVVDELENTETADSIEVSIVSTNEVQQEPGYKIERLPDDSIYSDFVVGPGRFTIEVAPGESKVVEMIVTNRMGIPKVFRFETEDMAGTDDSDTSVELLGDEIGPYTLKDYVSVPHQKITLNHGERARIPVTVAIPYDAEPGGFYGALLTSIVSEDVDPEIEGDAVPKSKLVSRIGTLFFVTTPGDIVKESKVVGFTTLGSKKVFSKGPIEFGVVIENTGSVHIRPNAEMNIFNTFGEEVGFVELFPWNILPKSVRTKEITWNREFLAGRYTAVLKLHRGYDDIVEEISYTFWVIPVKLVVSIFLATFVFLALIRFIATRFEFKRK